MNLFLKDSSHKVLAFGAHPDDLEVGAGGFLARLSHEGIRTTMVVVSIPNNMGQRYAEAKAGAKLLGADLVVLYEKEPCRVEDIKMYDLVGRFDQVIGDMRPSLVITHSENDLHFDHGLVHRATSSALRRTPCDLFAYLSSPVMNSQARSLGACFVDVGNYIDTKIKAIECHQSQLPHLTPDSSRDLARALGKISGCNYAETYEVLRMRI